MTRRKSGILMHISSLPSKYPIGDFGPAARRFVDFLQKAGQKIWQVLPLTATDPGRGNSPYSSISAFAINPLFISPEILAAVFKMSLENFENEKSKRRFGIRKATTNIVIEMITSESAVPRAAPATPKFAPGI